MVKSKLKISAFPVQQITLLMIHLCSVVVMCKPPGKEIPDVPPPITMLPPPPIPPATPAVDDLIQQSTWNLQQQEQHLNTLRQACRPDHSPDIPQKDCNLFFRSV